MTKKTDICSLSMKAGQHRTQVSDKARDAGQADMALRIRVSSFASKGELIRGIEVLLDHADNNDWPPVKNRKDKQGEPGGYANEDEIGAGDQPAYDPDAETDPED